nr:hypothetical protein BaRGS_011545 [Batillaria attramentaria]
MMAYIDYMQRRKKPNWDGIVEKIREKLPAGASVPTHERCRLKIKSQKEKYERLVTINNTPGKKPREIDRLLRAAFDPEAAGEIVVDVTELQGM